MGYLFITRLREMRLKSEICINLQTVGKNYLPTLLVQMRPHLETLIKPQPS